jgi:competence protein ComEC
MRRLAFLVFLGLAVCAPPAVAQRSAAPAKTAPAKAAPAKPLDIYVIDPEGGKASLWVTPSGETVLIDTGNPGERDLTRLMEVVTAAGVTKIDFLISTHYHVDHIGGLLEFVKRVPVGTFVDHGPNKDANEQVQNFWAQYLELAGKAKRILAKPGDRLPVTGLDWRVASAAGEVLKTPIAGAPGAGRANPACATTPAKQQNDDENAASLGSIVSFGQWRAADFGDLLWTKELAMVCPNNPLGTVDVFFVTHHGLDASNPPALIQALSPRVAVMQNGTTKGAAIEVMKALRAAPRLDDIWQLHWSYTAGIEHNAPGVFIANLEEPTVLGARFNPPPPAPPAPPAPAAAPAPAPTAPAAPAARGGGEGGGGGRGARGARGPAVPPHVPAHYIKISVMPNGSFTVMNSRNAFSKTYPAVAAR